MDLEESVNFSYISSETNETMGGDELAYYENSTKPPAIIIFRTLSIVIACSLIAASNFTNLAVLPHVKCFGEVTTFLLRSLAVTDLLTGICIAFATWPAIADYWPYGDILCKAIGSIGTFLTTASSLTLMCISIDRYLAVTRPLRYVSIVTMLRIRCALFAVWLVCVIFIVFIGTATWPPFQIVSYDRVLCNCIVKFFDGKVLPRALSAAAVCVVLPSVIITFTNVKLLMVSIHHAKRIDAMPGNRAEGRLGHKISSRELKAVRTTLVITGVFYLAWTPFIVTQVYQAISSRAMADWLRYVAGYLVLSNSWWNAFIYSFMNSSFSQKLRDMLYSKCPKCKPRETAGEGIGAEDGTGSQMMPSVVSQSTVPLDMQST